MKKSIGIFVALFVLIAISAQVQKNETEHFSAKYSMETEEYAIASLQVLEVYLEEENPEDWFEPYAEDLIINKE